MKKQLYLGLINTILRPYSLVAYGEDHTPTMFGIQTPDKMHFMGDLYDSWGAQWDPNETAFMSYSVNAKAEFLPNSDSECQALVEKARKFKQILKLSPVIWVKWEVQTMTSGKPRVGTGVYGTPFFSTKLGERIETKPDHKVITLAPHKDEIWSVNDQLVKEFTRINLIPDQNLKVRVEKPTKGEIRTHWFNY